MDSLDDFLTFRKTPSMIRVAKKDIGSMVVGTRVRISSSLESMLMYPGIGTDECGTVVLPKRASNTMPNFTYVKWDNSGDINSIEKRYLVPIGEGMKGNYMKLANDSMSDFIRSGTTNGVVHKSTKDLWSVSKGEDGGYVLNRLFKGDGTPLKEV